MIKRLYFYFVNTLIGIGLILILLFIWYSVSPDWISRNIISQLVSHDTKVFIRKNFIEKNFQKHINTIDKNQFINLGFKKIDLGFDYNDKKNLNHNVYQDLSHIDLWRDNLILASSEGNFFYFKNDDLANFINKKIKIESNLKNLHFPENIGFSVKDILVDKNYIYISYVELKNNDCLSLIIERAEINLRYLEFEKFFNPIECVNRSETLGNILHPGQAGGRISSFGEDKILFSTGNFRSADVSQNNDSIYGKILVIDKTSGSYEIMSKGHRNPQGLYSDNKIILSTEHGPYGGDEINLIKKNGNYGFPIASYGEPYSYNKSDEKFSFKKNHEGFVEPIFSFVPSIGISQIIKLSNSFNPKWQNNYLLSSLAGNSIYRIKFSENFDKIIFYETIYIGERIRDIIYEEENNLILLILEETASLGVLFNK